MKITVTYSQEEERAAQNLALIFINNFPGAKLKESKNNPGRGIIYIKAQALKGTQVKPYRSKASTGSMSSGA